MKTIGAFEAKTHLSELLEQVARGESFVITKRGKPVASLSPLMAGRKPDIREIIESFRDQYGTSKKKITAREITEFKAAGRR